MHLNRAELAKSYGVSLPTIDSWVLHECPRVSRGRPGVSSVFDLQTVAAWVALYKIGPDYSDPRDWNRDAFHRARTIVAARSKRNKRKPIR